MNLARRRLLGAAVASAVLAACDEKRVAETFPALALVSLDRPEFRLDHLQREGGGLLLVNYWATWCAPCREEMPSLERLGRRLPAEVRLVAVTVDEDLNLAREWLRRLGVTFPVFADPGSRQTRQALRLDTLPETFLLAPGGSILERTRGAREWDSEASQVAILAALARWKHSVAPRA